MSAPFIHVSLTDIPQGGIEEWPPRATADPHWASNEILLEADPTLITVTDAQISGYFSGPTVTAWSRPTSNTPMECDVVER